MVPPPERGILIAHRMPLQREGMDSLPARPVETWIQVLDGDGTPLADPAPGKAMQGEILRLDLAFRKPGEKGAVIIQWATEEGCTWSNVHPVGVDQPAAQAGAPGPSALVPLPDA